MKKTILFLMTVGSLYGAEDNVDTSSAHQDTVAIDQPSQSPEKLVEDITTMVMDEKISEWKADISQALDSSQEFKKCLTITDMHMRKKCLALVGLIVERELCKKIDAERPQLAKQIEKRVTQKLEIDDTQN